MWVLSEETVAVLPVKLAAPEAAVAAALALLSQDERARAERFLFEQVRTAFVLARAGLRTLLAELLEARPEQIRFSYGVQGKPALAWPDSPLRFNLAHSGGLAVYAWTAGCDVGVDVERIRPVPEALDLARRFLSPEESAEMEALDPSGREAAFFAAWTRKEARIKATGRGLVGSGDFFSPGEWTIHPFEPAPGYAAAVAFRDRSRRVRKHPLIDAGALLSRWHPMRHWGQERRFRDEFV